MTILGASVTAGTLFAVGDVIAQAVTHKAAGGRLTQDSYDGLRTARMSFIGFALNGPYFYTGFRILDRYYPTIPRNPPPVWTPRMQLVRSFGKSVTAHFTVFPPYLIALLSLSTSLQWWQTHGFASSTIIEDAAASSRTQPPASKTLARTIRDSIVDKGPETFVLGGVFWPVVNAVNFMYFTGVKRIMVLNFCGLFWNSFLSWQVARPAKEH
ncbi:hypothetical protein BCR44DRAFT_332814 [Catenaria anguillulae PL171]|uniref:Uncharacterized protein n=1 Tax=Catenaria anguillulae PL171 TaxID=765915 RepID=A0A1Y2HPZ2_9FUNG|nr:hypothetical protein BCR44DRAFT_332814 [Catenaria anguillulae PL171]